MAAIPTYLGGSEGLRQTIDGNEAPKPRAKDMLGGMGRVSIAELRRNTAVLVGLQSLSSRTLELVVPSLDQIGHDDGAGWSEGDMRNAEPVLPKDSPDVGGSAPERTPAMAA